jgi:hypothetical protein
MGILVGYAAITSGSWIIFLVIFLFYSFYYFKKNFNFFFGIILFFVFFFLTIFPWANMSYDYFGKILFNYLAYYPYVPNWSSLMYDIGLPDINNFWQKVDFATYFKNHFTWGLKNLFLLHLVVFPTFVYFFSFILLPVSFYAAWKLKSKGFILLIFTILYFLGLLFSSYASNGILFPRHFLVLLTSVSVLLSYGLILIYYKLCRYNFFKNIIFFFSKNKILLIIFPILITLLGIQLKTSFWERDSSHFFNFGKKINNITNQNDVIIYAFTPQDAWCVTGRKIVHDIAFNSPKTAARLKQEINKYKANYLLVDLSNYIYSRRHNAEMNIDKVLTDYYSNINLKEVLKDESHGYYFYKIQN